MDKKEDNILHQNNTNLKKNATPFTNANDLTDSDFVLDVSTQFVY